jgi:hypothetical protein
MRLARLRFTMGRMMVAVAILAILAWGGIVGEKRRAHFRDLTTKYARLGAISSAFHGSVPDGDDFERQMKAAAARSAKLGPYYAEMVRKYRNAERYPWLPVAPDAPEPE